MNDIENIEEEEKIKFIGTKIYYCNQTGDTLKVIGEYCGFVKETNFNEDYEIYSELKEMQKDTIGFIQLEYGKYTELSQGYNSVKVNLETKELEFYNVDIPIEEPEPTEEELKIQELENIIDEQDKLLIEKEYKTIANFN